MSRRTQHGETFNKLEDAVEYFMNISDSDDSESGFEPANCIVDFCQLPPDEDGRLTDEKQVNEDELNEITLAEVCGMIDVHLHSLGTETSNPGAEEGDTSTSDFSEPTTKKQHKDRTLPQWKKCDTFEKQFGIFHKDLNIDESMVPYYRHHNCKMFICGKPIQFGYKVWVLCSNNGYPYNMEIYGGKSVSHNKSLGSRVVIICSLLWKIL
ncbi:hypothetical protein PR048_011938 [Dryococelus australis]|uniref:PiggyBac transposable element-derived protein domain-containing protein n=1 Tax=Dryococelus australis TaxID=614101 RepID=A0ABQ9HN13_9NEOP|nr:hypothetical protein PR048_011938 [Dryococelus australis]